MAALIGVLNIIIFYFFDQPDGSTSWGYIKYILVNLSLQIALLIEIINIIIF